MAELMPKGKLRNMLDMQLTVGQVLAGLFATTTSVVATVIYINATYETKVDSERKFAQTQDQIRDIKDGLATQHKLQTEIYGDVKKISGILESQMAEKMSKRK
jgi:hypothetical protein